jgi:predicted esterase
LGRPLDYLESRAEINKDKLAFYGFSQGGIVGPILLARSHGLKWESLMPMTVVSGRFR